MPRTFLAPPVLVLALALAPTASAQVHYRLAFEPGGSQWSVEARLPARGGETLDFQIPVWTPGAYHPADYGRFVKDLSATDGDGRALEVKRVSNGRFTLNETASAQEFVIRYRADSMSTGVFTNDVIDVEANRITADYAYVNPVSLFGYVPGREGEPITLEVDLPTGWSAATVLEADAQGQFQAPSFLRFEDSPLLFSPTLVSTEFTVDGKPHTVSVHGASEEDVQALAAGCKRIVEAGSRLMGGLPYERYHFLFGFVPEGSGSGLEHTFSTLILMPREMAFDDEAKGLWGITAHEFFHLWCAERIHVEEIHHPDLSEPVETGTIWVNEGITEYFSRHLLFHAGFLDEDELVEGYLHSEFPHGALPKRSWTDVSRATVDWAGIMDVGIFSVRMYLVGPQTIFALDMTMRRETAGERGIFDLLQYLMANYVQKDRGFGEEELDDILKAVSGPQAVAFYERFIDGDEIPDPAADLDVIGYRFDPDRGLEPIEPIDPAQERARRDYLSESGRP